MIGIFFLAFIFLIQFHFNNFIIVILLLVIFQFIQTQFNFKKKDYFFQKFELSFNNFIIIFISFYLIHFYLLIQNHFESFFLYDFDYIGIEEVIHQTSIGNFFRTNHYGKFAEANYLSHHFAFILILFVPFQFLSSIKLGYAYANLFFFFVNLYLIFLILKKIKISEQNRIYSFLILTLNPFFYRLNFSYHFEIIYLCFNLAFIYFYLSKNKNLSWIFVFLILFIKEDIPIYQFLIGLFIFSLNSEKKYIYYSIFCILYFLFLKFLLVQYVGDSAKVNWIESWAYFGNSFSEYQTGFISALGKVYSKKQIFLSMILIFLLPFFKLKRIIVFLLPIFILHFSSERIWYNSFYNYYSYTILPFLIIGFIFSLKENIEETFLRKILLISLFFSIYYFYLDKSIPFKNLEPKLLRMEYLKEGIKLIPSNVKVRTSFDIGVFFPRNTELYPLKQFQLNEDFIFLDKNSLSPFVALNETEQEMKSKKNYELIYEKKNLLIWRRIELGK